MRTITLPAISRTIPLGAYLQGVRRAIRNPEATYSHGLTTWWSVTGAEIRSQFRDSVHDRINQGMSYLQRGVR